MENQQLLELIRQKDTAAIRSIYLAVADPCRKYIRNHGGNEADAHDVLQEAMFRFYRKVNQHQSLELSVEVPSYVFGMIKNVWREKTKQRAKMQTFYDLDEEGSPVKDQLADEVEEIDEEEANSTRVIQLLDQLGKNCKDILLAFYAYKMKLEDIAEEQGATYSYIKLKRHRCMEQLREVYRQKRA